MSRILIIPFIIILLSFAIGIYVYPGMPETIPSHWNAQGVVDGYMHKFWGIFLIPFISLVALFLLIYIPSLDPLKANIDTFRHYYNVFVIVFTCFLFYIHMLTIFWKPDSNLSIVQMLAPGFGILFYYIGLLLGNTKQNWFIGIRTPWTLANSKVWDLTHKLGANLFVIAGLISFIGLFTGKYAIFFILCPVLVFSAYTIIYSYVEYRKIDKHPARLKKTK
jgi:uncharacterized membrane protein